MMFLLSHDVADYRILLTGTFAETAIFSRPTLETREVRVRFQPFAAVGLHSLDKGSNRHRGWKGYEYVYMVRHTAYAEGLAVEIFCNAVDVGV